MSRGRISAILSLAAYLLSAATLIACDEPKDSVAQATLPQSALLSSPAPSAPAVDYVHSANSPFLKAYNERRFGKSPLKADQYDDIRNAHPENYAITEPPNVPGVRAMVEWEPMHAIVMSYPAYMATAANASESVAKIAMHTATVADVWIAVDGQPAINAITTVMQNVGMPQADIDNKVYFFQDAQIDSIWFIDSGPVPIIDPSTNTHAYADFKYYHQRAYDDGVSSILARSQTQFGRASDTVTYRMPVLTEGGTFQATTDGVCFTGTRQLFNMSCQQGGCDNSIETQPLADLQNHPLTQQLELYWGQYLGCKDVVVTYSITDDGTGHIDMYLKVIDDNTVMIGEYLPPFVNQAQQVNGPRMDANAALIDAYVKQGGGSMTSTRLVMPGHRTDSEGTVPFTYINSTFINGLNLWPATEYPEWTDSRNQALAQWQAAMPTYTHQYIDSTELSFWSGAIHCITRTVPAAPPAKWVQDGTCGGTDCNAPAGGYGFDCQPGENTSDVCWGPAWECYCNDCELCPDGPPGPTPDLCNGITYEGCCSGSELTYCENGELTTGDCGDGGCGWDNSGGWYDCQQTGEDPSGTYPLECPAPCVAECSGKSCGDDGCGGSCGGCASGESCTAAGACEACVPSCGGVDCGDDGCGGSCGTCGSGESCSAGSCVSSGDNGNTDNGGTPDTGGNPDNGGTLDNGGTADNGGPSDAGADTGSDAGGTPDGISGDVSVGVEGVLPVLPPSGGSSGCVGAADGGPASPTPLLGFVLLALLVATRRRT